MPPKTPTPVACFRYPYFTLCKHKAPVFQSCFHGSNIPHQQVDLGEPETILEGNCPNCARAVQDYHRTNPQAGQQVPQPIVPIAPQAQPAPQTVHPLPAPQAIHPPPVTQAAPTAPPGYTEFYEYGPTKPKQQQQQQQQPQQPQQQQYEAFQGQIPHLPAGSGQLRGNLGAQHLFPTGQPMQRISNPQYPGHQVQTQQAYPQGRGGAHGAVGQQIQTQQPNPQAQAFTPRQASTQQPHPQSHAQPSTRGAKDKSREGDKGKGKAPAKPSGSGNDVVMWFSLARQAST
ncbi:hypothetical protein EJ08DRAFT_717072 [Tothia fuscella]|uniref:Uncharacterized protein n=1 Tax=Tothia fuscella TaxID=1048955 RepID=A0A9P4TWV0_9PEZI|nr:hypothetical protein EJ08DRAFT_717072 [Tothia fuscella]